MVILAAFLSDKSDRDVFALSVQKDRGDLGDETEYKGQNRDFDHTIYICDNVDGRCINLIC